MAILRSGNHQRWPAFIGIWLVAVAVSSPCAAAVRHDGDPPDRLVRKERHRHAGDIPSRGPKIRLAEALDSSIDYRGTYWFDQNIQKPKPGAPRRDRPLTNFINRPDNRIYDDWDRRTFFDADKRLAPIGEEANQERERRPAIMILRLKF